MNGSPPAPTGGFLPKLDFSIRGAEPLPYAAAPTLKFALRIQALGQSIRSILLEAQIQIAARQRAYEEPAPGALFELFGTPERWSTTLRTLPWTRSTVIVPPFAESTTVDLLVACSYDLEVSAGRYFAALPDGEVPLEFLFSGTVFFLGPEGRLQTVRIALDHDVSYRLPVDVWRQVMDDHFPHTAWLRLGRDSFDRLCAYKAAHAHTSLDATIEALLRLAPTAESQVLTAREKP